MHQITQQSNSQSQQYFTFMLAGEEYGIDILKILEIRTLEHLTVLPSAPSFVKGVINLRGSIIPILDLRELFKIEPIPYDRSTVVIILQINNDGQNQVVGIIVDAFSDVNSIDPKDIKPKPEIAEMVGQDFIIGLANVMIDQNKSKLIILLDANSLLQSNDWDKVNLPSIRDANEKN
ncbi:MAG: chemotaxis protein CheW [Proteobacteria bacterium]|nr:chemotaxis protein CheW [Pseudomonadota bacterium]